MSSTLFVEWLEPIDAAGSIPVYRERPGARAQGLAELKRLIADHFVGEEIVLKMGGYDKAAQTIRNSLPSSKRTRSGDLGELIATEYVDAATRFRVPIRKLRWKSDREMPMHGNDVIGLEVKGRVARILKCECKSRARFGNDAVTEAAEGLDRDDGRPNPSTLAFIAKRLYESNRDEEALIFERLQIEGTLIAGNIEHLIFALAGTDPTEQLEAAPMPANSSIRRAAAGVVVSHHHALIASAFEDHGTKS